MKGLFLLFFFISPATANPWSYLGQGDRAAQEFLNQLDSKKAEAGSHPFYNGQTPHEANYTPADLTGRSHATAHGNPATQMIQKSSNARAQFKIDPQSDPLLGLAGKVMQNPLEVIGGKGTQAIETTQEGKDETLICEEAGEDIEHTCKSTLVVTIKTEHGPPQQGSALFNGPALYHSHIHQGLFSMPRVKSRHFVAHIRNVVPLLKSLVSQRTQIPISDIVNVSAGNNGGWIKVRHKRYSFSSYTINYSYRPLIKTPVFSWVDGCKSLEEQADQSLCAYKLKVCTQGHQTRHIEGVPVTQDCWEYTYTYVCSYPAKDDCGPLRARGCVQINSVCKQKVGNTCVLYTQTYQCKGNTKTITQIVGGQTPFCLDGNCRDQSWEKNDEMMSSLAQLSLLKEMQGQIKNETLFKGEDNRCSKCILSFKDCCGSGKGWGNDLGLSSCSGSEKNLSKKRQEKLCHYVGTYCAKKVLGQCIKKKSTYCCFGNKLLKAFHEQGRPQIGLGWGTPKEPLCRGFTIQEIQRIDFSKLDLREVFEDLMKNFKPGKMQNIGQQVGERLDAIKNSLIPNAKQQPKQRDGA